MEYLRENVDKKFTNSTEAVNEALKSSELPESESFLNYGNSCPAYPGCIVVAKRKDAEYVGFFKEQTPQGDYVVVSVNSKRAIGLVTINKEEIKSFRYPIIA